MLAPPTIFARDALGARAERAHLARAAAARPSPGTSPGSIVSRDIAVLGSRTCARPPICAVAIVQHDRDARAEADRRDDVRRRGDGVVGDLDANVERCVAHMRRKMRSRASTARTSCAPRPSSVSTLPSTRNPSGRERVVERLEQPLLRLAVEVDQHVAADDEIEAVRRRRRLGEQVAPLEAHQRRIVGDDRERRRRREVARAQLVAACRRSRSSSNSPRSRRRETRAVDVACRARRTRAELREHAAHRRRGDGRASPASTAPRPTSSRRSRRESSDVCALPQRRNDVRRHRRVRLPVPEELGDVDRQRVEQPVVLGAVGVEHARVVRVRVHAARAHAHRDAPAQALLLVARAAEAALAEILRVSAEKVAGVLLVDHQNTWRTASRFVRTMALSGSSSSARSQQRTASSRSCRAKRMLPSLR